MFENMDSPECGKSPPSGRNYILTVYTHRIIVGV